jgi:hypothetical protein
MMRLFASVQLSETDKKALIILLIVLIILVLILGLIGMAVRATMHYQARRADTMMHDVAVTHVIDNPKSFRRFGFKKNNRALFRDSLIPFAILMGALLVWIGYNIFSHGWGRNIWEEFGDLFVRWKTSNDQYPADDPLFVKVFGMTIIARWPETVEGYPRFEIEHLASYIVCTATIVAAIYYAVVCQAYISRAVMIYVRSNSVYEKSLAGYKASEDIKITPEKPIPPSD